MVAWTSIVVSLVGGKQSGVDSDLKEKLTTLIIYFKIFLSFKLRVLIAVLVAAKTRVSKNKKNVIFYGIRS